MKREISNSSACSALARSCGQSLVTLATGVLGLWLLAGAVAQAAAPQTERLYLSGHDKDDAVPWDFYCTTGRQSGYWTNLVVPSNWELHGFGTLSYHRDATNPPVEQGRYVHAFKVPSSWMRQRVFLVFEGVMTDTEARLNGQSVGPIHQGAYYRFKYEVTSLVKCGGLNRLEVDVNKRSSNPSVNNAERKGDYWMYGGIYRPVYLEAQPAQFIERVAIDAHADGLFKMEVYINGSRGASAVEAQLLTLDGKPVGEPFRAAMQGNMVLLTSRVESPLLWNAETPNLYQVEVRLKGQGQVLHQVRQRFGFRTMEVRDGDGLYVNGQRVVLKGANRHSFWPDSGRCLDEKVHRLDITTMKEMNMNAARMSHYPPDSQFLDLCDELGLYVLDEIGGWHGHYDDATGTQLVEEMVTRDVNHPCILFWDNGNEGGFNTNLDALYLKFDPQQRRVLHPWETFSGVNTAHYLDYDRAVLASQGFATHHKGYTSEWEETNSPERFVYMPTEMWHGLYDGGAGAGAEDYWNVMQASKYLGGGFIWAFLDEGIKRPDTGKIDVANNQAPDGIVGPYREREASFYSIKEVWSPMVVREKTLPADFCGSLTIENRFGFTDASQCVFQWELRQLARASQAGTKFKVLDKGQVQGPALPPGHSGALTLPLPVDWQKADVLALRVTNPKGQELWTWVWPLNGLATNSPVPPKSKTKAPAVALEQTSNQLLVKAGKVQFSFSPQSGYLTGVQRGAQKFSLANGPRPAEGAAGLVALQHQIEGTEAVLTATYTGTLSSVTWHIRPDGWARCDYAYKAEGPREFFGVAFDYPEGNVKAKRWLGVGPFRVWKNRLVGGTLNVWENKYNDTVTGWLGWDYPEFKGFFGGVRWMQLETTEGLITCVPAQSDKFVQVLTPSQPPLKLRGQTSLDLPQVGLAFMDAIPPIGSKFKRADKCGPQSQLAVAAGEYKGSVSFFFGKLP